MKKLLRKPYRELLKIVTKKIMAKHQPIVIAILGDGQTSIAREVIYQLIKEKYPVRRNLESPEAEFSVPLTIIGYPKYPTSYFEWAWVLIKTYLGINIIKSYKHFLVLELNSPNTEILDYWIDITKPTIAMIVGRLNIDYTKYNFSKVVKVSGNGADDVLGPFKIGVKQIGRYLNIDNDTIEKSLESINFPESKIRLFPGKNKSFVIDATHYYFPLDIQAALDLSGDEDGRKIIFSNIKVDIEKIKNLSGTSHWLINPTNFIPENNDTIIVRGNRTKVLREYENLFDDKHPLF